VRWWDGSAWTENYYQIRVIERRAVHRVVSTAGEK